MDLDQALKEITTYTFGQSRKNLIAVADHVRDSYSQATEREKLRRRFTALLSSDATTDCKKFACEQLSIIGTAEEVPALAKLLTDEKLSHMARIALERIPGAASDAALRDALKKTKGKLLIGVINSLGERRDRESAGAVARFATDSDDTIAEAAAAALGKIGGREAAKALGKAKSAASPKVRAIIADAMLKCAEQFLGEGNKDEAARIYRELSTPAEARQVRDAARRGLEASERK